jgi:hypothetical protein
MGTRAVEILGIGLDIAAQVPVTQDQDMVQQFTANAATGVWITSIPLLSANRSNCAPNLHTDEVFSHYGLFDE